MKHHAPSPILLFSLQHLVCPHNFILKIQNRLEGNCSRLVIPPLLDLLVVFVLRQSLPCPPPSPIGLARSPPAVVCQRCGQANHMFPGKRRQIDEHRGHQGSSHLQPPRYLRGPHLKSPRPQDPNLHAVTPASLSPQTHSFSALTLGTRYSTSTSQPPLLTQSIVLLKRSSRH